MIDWSRVDDLRQEVGEEDFEEVVQLFLEEVEEVLDRLASAPDPVALEMDMHFLKGSALNLGFSAFAALCQDGEGLAEGGQGTQVDVHPILSAYSASKDQFLRELNKRDAA